jgi:trans-2-enoyl-CoA reductase
VDIGKQSHGNPLQFDYLHHPLLWETTAQMAKISEANIFKTTDLTGFKHDFMEIHDFDVKKSRL